MTTQIKKTWRKVKLGEVMKTARVDYEKVKTSEYQQTGRLPIFDQGSDTIAGYTDNPKAEYRGKSPAILFGDHTLKLKIAQPPFAIGADGIQILEPNENLLDRKFFYYALKGLKVKSYGYERHMKYLRELDIACPTVSDQKRIADILSAFDDKIELNNKISRTLEQMAQGIFKEWFVNSEKLKVKSEKLSRLVKTQYGYTESASTKKIGPKFLRVMDINKTNWIDWGTVPYCKISDAEYPKYKLKRGDVVIARMANPGKVAIVEENIDAVFASYLIRLQIIGDDITPYFLFYYLRSQLYQDFIFGASTGTTRQSANARVITDVELAIPQKKEILEFEDLASMIRNKILANVKENQKLAALRDLLLPKLMSGEFIVKS